MTDSISPRTTGDSGRTAIVLNRDLLFGSRIRGALGILGLTPRVTPNTESFIEALRAVGADAAIGIIDMNSAVDWEVLAPALRGAANPPPTLAFGPHTDVENRRLAKAAGVTRIVSNGQFQQQAAELIERYRRA
ncbi:MAG: hypothetical protein IT338_10630 [Thermomicrobiales bacterium]|nr:hypothetical protein [Thermomicrobiales bacterium]